MDKNKPLIDGIDAPGEAVRELNQGAGVDTECLHPDRWGQIASGLGQMAADELAHIATCTRCQRAEIIWQPIKSAYEVVDTLAQTINTPDIKANEVEWMALLTSVPSLGRLTQKLSVGTKEAAHLLYDQLSTWRLAHGDLVLPTPSGGYATSQDEPGASQPLYSDDSQQAIELYQDGGGVWLRVTRADLPAGAMLELNIDNEGDLILHRYMLLQSGPGFPFAELPWGETRSLSGEISIFVGETTATVMAAEDVAELEEAIASAKLHQPATIPAWREWILGQLELEPVVPAVRQALTRILFSLREQV